MIIMALRKALLIPTLMVVLAFLLYEPVPSYVQDRYGVALHMGMDKLYAYIASAADLIGMRDAGPQFSLYRAAELALATPSLSNSSRVSIAPSRYAGSRALVFRPAGAKPGGPGLVWIHGGGWWHGSPEASAGFAARFAAETNVTVVAIAYRRAPEHAFPAALDDCVAAVREFLASGAAALDVNPHRVMLGGDSAGGQLAAAATQLLSQPDEAISPRLQLLVYPITQLANLATQSHRESHRTPLLASWRVAEAASMYLTGSAAHWRTLLANGHASKAVRLAYAKQLGESMPPEIPGAADAGLSGKLDRLLRNPRVSPLLAPGLDSLRLPPAYIVACQHDPLRSDAHMYAQRLERAGVRVYYKHYACYHGCLYGQADAKQIVDDLIMFFNSNAML